MECSKNIQYDICGICKKDAPTENQGNSEHILQQPKATTCQLITEDILNYLIRESLIDKCNDNYNDVRNNIFSIIDSKL
jgi:hypothetical protein